MYTCTCVRAYVGIHVRTYVRIYTCPGAHAFGCERTFGNCLDMPCSTCLAQAADRNFAVLLRQADMVAYEWSKNKLQTARILHMQSLRAYVRKHMTSHA